MRLTKGGLTDEQGVRRDAGGRSALPVSWWTEVGKVVSSMRVTGLDSFGGSVNVETAWRGAAC